VVRKRLLEKMQRQPIGLSVIIQPYFRSRQLDDIRYNTPLEPRKAAFDSGQLRIQRETVLIGLTKFPFTLLRKS
jgi:hypothetical protein